MIQRSSIVVVLTALATGVELVGCGLKGPLYIPDDTASQEVSSQPGTANDTKKQRSTSGGTPGAGIPPAVPTDTTGSPPSSPPTGN